MNARQVMIDRHRVDNFAGDLTVAVYRVLLQHGAGERWLPLQLDLWHAITDTIDKWESEFRNRGSVKGATDPTKAIGLPGPVL